MDYYIPVWGTKKLGGTKYGKYGATVGLIIGIFTGPWGIVLGPFIGAVCGELIHDNKDFNKAFKSGIGAFLGFIVGTLCKASVCVIFAYYFIKAIW